MTGTVTKYQRFTREFPCPVCRGFREDRQHKGTRCWGYMTTNQKYAICEREELAGPLPLGDWGYRHYLAGPCHCGQSHDGGAIYRPTYSPNKPTPITRPKPIESGRRKVREIPFGIKDTAGELQAEHVRTEFDDGSKQYYWRRNGANNLGGRRLDSLPFYGSELISGWADGSLVVITEGEKAARSLIDRGQQALASVTGAKSQPSLEILNTVKHLTIVLWPDNDEDGEAHMQKIGASLTQIGADVRVVCWAASPPKGDAADFIGDVGELLAKASPLSTGTDQRADPLNLIVLSHQAKEDGNARLAEAMEEVLGYTKARSLADCGTRFSVYQCPVDAQRICKPRTCGNQNCLSCGPTRLAIDWRFKLEMAMEWGTWRLREARPKDTITGPGVLKTIRKRINKTKDRLKRAGRPPSMIYGIRFEEGMNPVVLLVEPADDEPITNSAFDFTDVATSVGAPDALRWLQLSYQLESLRAWDSPADLAQLLEETKGRHRFQAVGPRFQGVSFSPNDVGRKEPPPSGGSGHGAGLKVEVKCPYHPEAVLIQCGFEVSGDQVGQQIKGSSFYWLDMDGLSHRKRA